MLSLKNYLFSILILLYNISFCPTNIENIVSYEVDLNKEQVDFYLQDDKKEYFKSLLNLKNWIESKNKKLLFAMNGGMYKTDNSPQGLYIENYKIVNPIDTNEGNGNFYLMPNGIFYITNDNQPRICTTKEFRFNSKIKNATQSGPMLVIDGEIHPAFKEGSLNLNIRNGVGILPNNHIIFLMSKQKINFYDFALYFKNMGCKNALYLDGFVSRTYLPEKNWVQLDGNFGVIIGVTKK